jgi:hypothetical protein
MAHGQILPGTADIESSEQVQPAPSQDFEDPNFNIALMTDGKPTASRKPRMCCLLWNLIAAAKQAEFAPSPLTRAQSSQT